MEETKNVCSAHVFDLKLVKEFYLVFRIYCKFHLLGEGKYYKKQFDLFYLVFNSYASALIKQTSSPEMRK